MISSFAEELFRLGVPESKKLKLIYCQGASLSEDDLQHTVTRLRADCRYARLLGALIDASKNEKLAIEEVSSENGVSSKIVTRCKWLYMEENRGFISEDFIRNTLPSVSFSSQMQIANKISKWVTNTDLGDKLFAIVHNRWVWLSWMLLGACSNDLIMKQIRIDEKCLSMAQMLDILRKRFSSGIELIHRINEAGKLRTSAFHTQEVFLYILKHDIQRGVEFMHSIGTTFSFGRHLTHKLLQSIVEDKSRMYFLIYFSNVLKQRVLAQRAPRFVYQAYLLAKFDVRFRGQGCYPKLEFLKHLRDDVKLKLLEAWFARTYSSNMVEMFHEVPQEFLFLLDEESLQEVVTQWIALASSSEHYSESDVQFWQSMLPDDEESFKLQKERLKGENSESVRKDIYLNMLNSVFILRRPQFLARRLKFVVPRTRNDYDSQEALVCLIHDTLWSDHRFRLNEEIWPFVKELIDLQLFLNNEAMHKTYEDLVFVGLLQVSLEQKALFESIMQELNEVQVLVASENYDVTMLPREKRLYYWNAALKYRENLEDTSLSASGGVCPHHLQNFYIGLAQAWEDTRDLIENYPRTMQILKFIISPGMNFERFPNLDMEDVFSIYKMLEPLLPPGDALFHDLEKLIEEEKADIRRIEVLRAFRKSKVITDEVRAIYTKECLNRDFILRCGRSLLHADAEQFSKWLTMLEEYIKTTEETKKCRELINTYILKTMICSRLKLEEEMASLNKTEVIDSEMELEYRKQLNLVRSLRYFNDSALAYEMTVQFMKLHCVAGRSYKHRKLVRYVRRQALCSLNHHLSHLPVATVIRPLHEHILQKDFERLARRSVLRAVLAKASMFEGHVVVGILEQLMTHEEDREIMHETLKATYNFVKRFGEEKGWRLMKLCLDSTSFELRSAERNMDDRQSYDRLANLSNKFLLDERSIDEYIPNNIEYLMRLVFALYFPVHEARRKDKYSRLVLNIKMLSLDFLLEIFETTKDSDWSKESGESLLAMSILSRFVPTHAETLKTHFSCLGETWKLDLKNLTTLTERSVRGCVGDQIENAAEVLDFLRTLLETGSEKNTRELCLLKLAQHTLPLLRQTSNVPAFIRTALRLTRDFLETFGDEFYALLVKNLKILLESSVPMFLSVYMYTLIADPSMNPVEIAMLLSSFDLKIPSKKSLENTYPFVGDEMLKVVVRAILYKQ